MAARAALAAALGAVLLGGCVTSRVLTDDPGAVVWFDGRPVGPSGSVWSMGPPHTAHVLVVASDGRRARAVVQREFSWFTFAAGLRTLGVCFVFCWTYPDNVVVPLPPRLPDVGWDADPTWDPWDAASDGSAWMRAPGRGPPVPGPVPPLARGEGEIFQKTSTSSTATPTSPPPTATPTPPESLPSPPPGERARVRGPDQSRSDLATSTPTPTTSGRDQGPRDTGGGSRAREPGHVYGHGDGASNVVPIDDSSSPTGATP